MFLKLTSEFGNHTYVNSDCIALFFDMETFTIVVFTKPFDGDDKLKVKETPEEIVVMLNNGVK